GPYHLIANSGGHATNAAPKRRSTDLNENVVVSPRSPAVVTDAGPDVVLGVNGTDLTDSATLSGGTADIGGTITFSLFSDANCQTHGGSDRPNSGDKANAYYVFPVIHI